MPEKNILDKAERFIKRNGSFDWLLKRVIDGFEDKIKHFRHISCEGNLDAIERSAERIAVVHQEIEQRRADPKTVLRKFQELVDDSDVKLSLDRYAQYMQDGLFDHCEQIQLIFTGSAYGVPEAQALDLAKIVNQSDVMRKAAQLGGEYLSRSKHYSSADGFCALSRKCPVSDKKEFMHLVDPMVYFKACIVKAGAVHQAGMYASMLSEESTPDALRFMKFSDTWCAIPKTPALRDALYERDERLLPALDYSG